jgi:pSer/pThr/pTyr-binding forkhead associated (FHA) protein
VSAIILLGLRILLAALLYGFLGYAVYILMRDLKQQGELLAARQPPPIILTNLAQDPATPLRYAKPVVILGREASCDFALDDQTVSSHHARLAYRKQQWWLEDLASTNGTYLNGEMVNIPVVITHGDEVRLGTMGVRIEIGQPSTDHSG